MRKRHKILTFIFILLTAAGVVLGAVFLREEARLEQQRQMRVTELSQKLQPFNEERKQWEAQDKEWVAKLEEQRKGRPCVLLNFDSMSSNLYETIFEMMEQYGFRGTFAFRNGRLPGSRMTDVTRYEFDELMHSGWEYALSFGEEREVDETLSYWERKEEELEEEQEKEKQSDELLSLEIPENSEGQETAQTYLEQLDSYIALLQANGVTLPTTLFCDGDQYVQTTEEALAQRGFQMVCVKEEESFPQIGERGTQIWKIDSGVYKQKDEDIVKELDKILTGGGSVAIFINDVQKLSKDASYDLSLTKFTSLLNYLKGKEEQGEIYLLTYSELNQYEEQQAQEYETMTREYAAFHQEMDAALEELDQSEQAIVEKLREQGTKEEESLLRQLEKKVGIGAKKDSGE